MQFLVPSPQSLADFEEELKKHGELSACAFVHVSFLFLPVLGKKDDRHLGR